MTRTEFGEIVAYITAGCGKALGGESLEVYFDCLGDLDRGVFQLAARRVLMEHKWATFPSVAELRAAAVDSVRGQIAELSAAEAWDMAWEAVANIDPELSHTVEAAFKTLPPLVAQAISSFGLLDLCYGKEPVGVLRGQFMKLFEQLAARDRRAALLPPATHAALKDIREKWEQVSTPVREALEGIGRPAA